MAIYNNRICKICGRTFSGGPRAWYCPECRYERRKEQDRLAHGRGPRRKLGAIDYCEVCNNPYIIRSGTQRYCPECVPERYAETDRKQGLEYYNTNKEQINQKRNGKRGTPLVEITCAVCGKIFLGRSNHKCCSDACRKESYKMYCREYERNHPGRKKLAKKTENQEKSESK